MVCVERVERCIERFVPSNSSSDDQPIVQQDQDDSDDAPIR